MKIKLMNYNILYRFHTRWKPFRLEKDRLHAAQKIVNEQKPNILVLTEACFGTRGLKYKKYTPLDYGELFGFQYALYENWESEPEWGNCVLSRYPIIDTSKPKLGKRDCVRAKIDLGSLVLTIDVIHPEPYDTEEEKVEQVRPLIETLQEPYIITGDFNSYSTEDVKNYDRGAFLDRFGQFLQNRDPKKIIDMLFNPKLIPYLESNGLRDAFVNAAQRSYTIPTDLCTKDKSAAARTDHIFVKGRIKVKTSYVIKSDLTEIASDHYPVCSILTV